MGSFPARGIHALAHPLAEDTMRTLLLALAVSTPLAASAQTAPAQPAGAPAAQKSDAQGVLDERAEIIAKNLTLTADQAAKFWPLYQKYQAGFTAVLEEQIALVKSYAAKADTLDDAAALEFVEGLLDRDAKVAAYRKKWLPEFKKILPGKLAAKFMQMDRRLSLVTQVQIFAQTPIIQ